MADNELKKYDGHTLHRGPDRSAPYPVSRLAPAIDLVDIAREISQADAMLNNRTSAKLKVIADQIKALQNAARTVLEDARQDQALHHAECAFKRQSGKVYYLYRRAGGSQYFSMLSPLDWHGSPPHEFAGAYRLEADLSWTPAEHLDEDRHTSGDTQAMIERLLEDGRF